LRWKITHGPRARARSAAPPHPEAGAGTPGVPQ
jgi:hypothetical protein